MFSLSGEVIRDERVGLYLVAAMGYFRDVFSYAKMGTWPIIKDMNICLPTNSSGEPDIEFMSERIGDLQEKCVRKLEIWLKEAGYVDS